MTTTLILIALSCKQYSKFLGAKQAWFEHLYSWVWRPNKVKENNECTVQLQAKASICSYKKLHVKLLLNCDFYFSCSLVYLSKMKEISVQQGLEINIALFTIDDQNRFKTSYLPDNLDVNMFSSNTKCLGKNYIPFLRLTLLER